MDRILLGNRGGSFGLWVSKQGFDVKSAGVDGMLLSSGEDSMQALIAGSFSTTVVDGVAPETVIATPFIPYTPVVLLNTDPDGVRTQTSQGQRNYYPTGVRYRKVSDYQIGITPIYNQFGTLLITVSYIVFARPQIGQ